MALVEHGAVPGVEWQDDVDSVIDALSGEQGRALVVYRIPRDVAEYGYVAGKAVAEQIARLPASAKGGVVLSFDGWADDPRPLCAIPCAVAVCRGLLGVRDVGDGTSTPVVDEARCSKMLAMLFDERQIDPVAWEVSGALWVVGHAFSGMVFEQSADSTSGWTRDPEANLFLLYWLQDGCPALP